MKTTMIPGGIYLWLSAREQRPSEPGTYCSSMRRCPWAGTYVCKTMFTRFSIGSKRMSRPGISTRQLRCKGTTSSTNNCTTSSTTRPDQNPRRNNPQSRRLITSIQMPPKSILRRMRSWPIARRHRLALAKARQLWARLSMIQTSTNLLI